MHHLQELWLPILVTAIAVFVASSLIHMVFKWHNSDYRKLANEDEVSAAIRAGAPAPGLYLLPHCADMKAMLEEPMQKKFRDGPVALLTVKPPGPPAIGGALLKWFLLTLVLATVAGLTVRHIYAPGSDSKAAGHLVGLLSFLAYGCGSVQNGIWMGKPWASVAKDLLDAFIYGTISGLVFWQLWP